MNDVKRYTFKGAAGEYVYAADFDNAVRCFLDSAERCIGAERREASLQKRLTDADETIDQLRDRKNSIVVLQQRVDLLEGLLQRWTGHFGHLGGIASGLRDETKAALKPAGGASDE